MKKLILAFLLLVVASSAAYHYFAKSEKSLPTVVAEIEKNLPVLQKRLDFSETLVARLPEDVLGFAYITAESSGFKRLSNSSWDSGIVSKSFDSLIKNFSSKVPEAARELLPRLKSEFLEVAFSFNSSTEPPGNISMIAKFDDSDLASKLLGLQKEMLIKKGELVEELSLARGRGFKTRDTIDPLKAEKQEVYYAEDKDHFFISSNFDDLNEMLAESSEVPKLLSSADFKNETANIVLDDLTSIAFVDLNRVLEDFHKKLSPVVAGFDLRNFGLKSFFFSTMMSDAPSTRSVLNYEPTKFDLFSNLTNASHLKMLNLMPKESVGVFSLDASLVKNLVEVLLQVLAEQKSPSEISSDDLEMLNSLKMLAISQRAAPLGQSIFPIPEFLAVVQSSKSQELTQMIKREFVKNSKEFIKHQDWLEKEIEGTNVNYTLSPLGVGFFIGNLDDLIFVTTNEVQMRDALVRHKSSSSDFISSLSEQTSNALSKDSISTFYLNNRELAEQLRSFRGLLVMWTGAKGANDVLSQEAIDEIKERGNMITSTRLEEGRVVYRASYVINK